MKYEMKEVIKEKYLMKWPEANNDLRKAEIEIKRKNNNEMKWKWHGIKKMK